MRHAGPIHGVLVAVLLLAAPAAASAQGLPGGATSLNEAHGDWTVNCTAAGDAVRCAMLQNQVSNGNRQRVLAVQLAAVENGAAADGVLVLPFGLRLDAGVRLAIDESAALPERRFSTCLPEGCVVPLAFDAATVTALRAGTALRVTATANDSGQEVAFSISLSGFTSALARAAALSGP